MRKIKRVSVFLMALLFTMTLFSFAPVLAGSEISISLVTDSDTYELGQPITINYQISGGSGSYDIIEYYCWSKDTTKDKEYSIVGNNLYAASGSFSFTPTKGDVANVIFGVTDSEGNQADTGIYNIPLIDNNPPVIVTTPITASVSLNKSSCNVGEEITATYSISGGSGSFKDIMYYCYVYDAGSPVAVKSDELTSTSGTFSFTPQLGQSAYVSIQGCDAVTDEDFSCRSEEIEVIGATVVEPINVKFTLDRSCYKLGQEITVKFSITGGSGIYRDLVYEVAIENADGFTYEHGQVYDGYNTVSFTLYKGQAFYFYLTGQDSDGRYFGFWTDRIPLNAKSISGAKVSSIKNQTYSGKAIKPKPTVTLNGKTLKEGTDYTLSYKNNKDIGTATVTVTGTGKYVDTVTTTFKINPKKVSLKSLKAGSKKLTANWGKQSGVTGYQIEYSLKKSFKNKETVTVKGAKKEKKEIKKLTKGKTYYVRIRAYKTVGKEKFYSAWSKVLKVKIK